MSSNAAQPVILSLDARARAAHDAADKLQRSTRASVFVGFDGFVDVICSVVDQRRTFAQDDYDAITAIPQLAQRVAQAAGRSANLELVVRERRFGGNGPLLAGALAAAGARVSFAGCIADESDRSRIHTVFRAFANSCHEVYQLAPPATTIALEFTDGKVMLNMPDAIQHVAWGDVEHALGGSNRLADFDALCVVNWSIMAGVGAEEHGLIKGIINSLRAAGKADAPRIVLDISDPAKRTDTDVARLCAMLSELATLRPVTLSLNLSEALRLSRVLGLSTHQGNTPEAIALITLGLRDRLAIDTLCVHPRHGAAGATDNRCVWVDGPFTRSPTQSTGAGDHFAAGLALAQCAGLELDQALCVAVAISGAYVRDARSPSMQRLLAFLRDLPPPQLHLV